MEASGSPAERRIWNVQADTNLGSQVMFDAPRWWRGVIVCRMMLLPAGQEPTGPAISAAPKPGLWTTCRIPDQTIMSNLRSIPNQAALANGGYIYIYQGYFDNEKFLQQTDAQNPLPASLNYDGLHADRQPRGVWHRLALYFDTEAPGGVLYMYGSWPEDRGEPPPASAWTVKRGGIPVIMVDEHTQVGLGLAAKGVLLSVQGLKLVPLGPDMPPPPDGWQERVNRKVNSKQQTVNSEQ